MTEVRDDVPTPDSLRLAALYPTSEQTVSFGYNSLQPTAPTRVAAIRKTLRTVEPSLTGVYPLVINGRRGFVLFFPVTDYVFDNGLSKFGTVWLPFAIEPFFEQIYRQIPNDISMSVYDFGPGGNRSEVLPGDEFIWARWSANHKTDDLSYLTSVNITAIDRVWSMDCSPSKPFIAKYTTPWSIISLCVIIFATIVVCLFLHHGLTQFEHAKKEAKLRTKQLQHSSRVMEAISTYSKTVVQLIPDSLIVIDDNGYIIGTLICPEWPGP
ncbi:hypothetical protein BKA69DRAFT_1077757 [Paraphysoderma sedebokerense]|nr:hypothetical protein BKA69DRAFT_1077721 [Paraphysoderma sedebokerense]KAI9140797.1 hypothetical protein BKA69DRAFT_1077757 [Paraphysoderma sedebokerense]